MKQLHFCYWTKKPKSLFKESPISTQNLSHAKFLKFTNSILFTIVFVAFAQFCWGQNQYQSNVQTGTGPWLWNSPSSWRFSTDGGINWDDASSYPTSTNSEYVEIQVGHVITISDNQSAKDLFVSGNLIIEAGVQLNVTGDTEINNKLAIQIRSNSQNSGALMSGTFTNTFGSIKVERFMSKSDSLHLYSSPVTETLNAFIKENKEIPDLYSAEGILIGVGMRDYNTDLDQWNSYMFYRAITKTVTGLPTGDVLIGKGYSVRTLKAGSGANAGMIVSTGFPNPDNNVNMTLNLAGNKWNLVGNPFTCALSVADFLAGNTGSIEGGSYFTIYLWDTNHTLMTPAQYVPVNYATPGITGIQLGQGFFVKAKSGGSGSVSFTPGMRIFDPTITFKSAQVEFPTIRILATSQSTASSTQIKFISNTSRGLDPGYDAGMIKQDPDFALYSKLLDDNGVDFTLQCLPDKNFDQYVIPIGIDCKVGGDIVFTAETVNLPSGCQALLEDRLTKRFTRLDLKDAKYTATMSADTKGTGRFFLHTSDVISGDQPIEKEQFKINTIGKTIYINGEVSEKANFFVYSIDGKLLSNFKAESLVQNQFDASRLPIGVYILTVNDQNQKKSVKFVIEK